MKTYIYVGDEFPNEKGRKVTIIKELVDRVQVKVMDEGMFVKWLGVWGITFHCKRNELEEAK